MQAIALPNALQHLQGRITDVDSHEMMPAQEWVKHFGPEVQAFADAWMIRSDSEKNDKNHPSVPDYPGDIMPIGADIGNIKGARAPGATDPARRLDVMDAMGISKQLMFPSGVGLHSFMILAYERDHRFLATIKGDRHATAKKWITLYNEWAISAAKVSDRVRPTLPVFGDTPEELISNARHLIKNGIRAIWIAANRPPGGRSPAHPDLDPFWAMLAESNTVVTLHAGTEGNFFKTDVWKEAPAFEGYRALSEFETDPWSMSVFHLPCQNFLATIVNGGVFERHPTLRFGVIEVGSFWVGPLMEGLDMWHQNFAAFAASRKLSISKKPSDYIRSNVRVSIFPFETVDLSIERYGLEDVLCFCTDYPHVEGGKDVFNTLYNKVKRLGPAVVEKFFVTNGEFLLP